MIYKSFEKYPKVLKEILVLGVEEAIKMLANYETPLRQAAAIAESLIQAVKITETVIETGKSSAPINMKR